MRTLANRYLIVFFSVFVLVFLFFVYYFSRVRVSASVRASMPSLNLEGFRQDSVRSVVPCLLQAPIFDATADGSTFVFSLGKGETLASEPRPRLLVVRTYATWY